MTLQSTLEQHIDDHLSLITQSKAELVAAAQQIGDVIAQAFQSGNKLLIFGNGGSAGDAQHMAAEFINRYKLERPPLPAIALTTDTSTITSIANDYEYRDVFAKQVRALGNAGDVVIGISTSGSSPNVTYGLKESLNKGCKTVALLGRTGGEAKTQADIVFIAPHEETARIQEAHLLLEHLICDYVEHALFIAPN